MVSSLSYFPSRKMWDRQARKRGLSDEGRHQIGEGGRVMALLACEALFGKQRGREVRTLIEKLADDGCPCVRGVECPLLCKDDDA